ncbi:cytokine receptor-like factor 2 isoform X2 [Hoplias malabaricus]
MSQSINMTWEKPDKKKNTRCYSSHVRYRLQCHLNWQDVENIKGLSFVLPAPDLRKTYVFKIRTKLECIGGNWSKWSPDKLSRNVTGNCNETSSSLSSFNIKKYLVPMVLSVVCFLLVYACVSQERVRRLVLPIIPDPKHIQERLLSIEQVQFTIGSHSCEEFEIAQIELADLNEEQKCEITQEPPLPKPTDIITESHDLDFATNNSMYCLYSDLPEDKKVPLCSHTMPGYIII